MNPNKKEEKPNTKLGHSRKTIKFVCYIFGFILDPKKEEKPTTTLSLLGTQVTLNQFNIEVNLPLRKRTELIEELGKILQKRRLSPAAAAKIQHIGIQPTKQPKQTKYTNNTR